jgi:hypothetical protein
VQLEVLAHLQFILQGHSDITEDGVEYYGINYYGLGKAELLNLDPNVDCLEVWFAVN